MNTYALIISTAIALICASMVSGNDPPRPNASEWINGKRQPRDKLNLISYIVDGCFYYNRGGTKPVDIDWCSFNATGANEPPPEFQAYDGFSNNVFNTQLGAIDTPLLRRVPPVYSDGTYKPVAGNRINPFDASEQLMKRSAVCSQDGGPGTEACGSKTGKSAFLVFFGQQVVEEILDAQRPGCPPEYFNIAIPENHPFRNNEPRKSAMPFLRSRYSQATGRSPGNPRQQLNEITPWIDGGLIYGTSKGWADVLRTFPNGTVHPHGQLASEGDNGLFPVRNKLRLPMANPPPPARHAQYIAQHETENVNRFYVLGNPRGNENAFLLSFGIILFRWHNQFATYLHESRPSWSGERVFNEARKWAIGTYQHIVVNNWLPEWLGESLEPYTGYNPSVDPQIEQFFQTAAMRFGHTLVTPGAYMRDYSCAGCTSVPFPVLDPKPEDPPQPSISTGAVRTCNIYWRPQEPLEMRFASNACIGFNTTNPEYGIADVDRLLMGMASQRAEREDNMIVEDLRGNVFGPLEFSRRDLMAINIQRGRDHGTPDYNTAREAFGLNRITSVDEYLQETESHTPREIVETMEKIHTPPNGEASEAWKNIDVWTGGILETSTRPGPLFRAIIKDQFTRIRDADRFWFENTKFKTPRFSKGQIERIKTLTVFDLVVSVTRMLEEDLQPNPFRVPTDNSGFDVSCGNRETPFESSACLKLVFNSDGQLNSSETETCFQFPQLDSRVNPVEKCTLPGTYDYFSGSEISFILTHVFLGIFIAGVAATLHIIVFRIKRMKGKPAKIKRAQLTASVDPSGTEFAPLAAREWLGKKEGTRPIIVAIAKDTIEVRHSPSNQLAHTIRIYEINAIESFIDERHYLIISHVRNYDLVLEFDAVDELSAFKTALETKLRKIERPFENLSTHKFSLAVLTTKTKAHRVAVIEKFFQQVFAALDSGRQGGTASKKSDEELQFKDLELTKPEFAEALGMSPSSPFLEYIFDTVDLDQNGRINFLELFTMLALFKSGTPKDKSKYLFKIYDKHGDGKLLHMELNNMIKFLVQASSTKNSGDKNNRVAEKILKSFNLGSNQGQISYEQFEKIIIPQLEKLGLAELRINDVIVNRAEESQRSKLSAKKKPSYFQISISRAVRMYGNPDDIIFPVEQLQLELKISAQTNQATSHMAKRWYLIQTWFEANLLIIFWTTLYTSVVIAIFAERAYSYSYEREHGGLRQIAGYGVTVTRGAASAQMFCYASLLLTMCRNLITRLRETFLRQFVPFDSFIAMHKYIACLGLFFSVIHVIGHGINFYHISTQTADDVSCLFREYFRPTHVLPKFHYWAFQTVTGISGILLVLLATVIYIFATTYARMHAFKLFWITHSFYPLWYALILLHGSGRLVQSPLFLNFLIGPLVIFILDKLVTLNSQSVEISVFEAEFLPSDVLKLKFARPHGFEFKSGQWIHISCTALNRFEFHPFTISSSPYDDFLTVHIRARGPFTTNISQAYQGALPNLLLDGPFGERHQDWPRYEVSVLIGGGIGVTPFASIMKDVAAHTNFRQCKQIYFLWITRTQKQYEWMVDIIRDVEGHNMISVHVYITQDPDKFDLRTILLYACERCFHKLNQRSLLTGLRSPTHFERPNFVGFFRGLRQKHAKVSKFGVFSCGPPSLTKGVDEACQIISSEKETIEGGNSGKNEKRFVEFQHYSENI